MITTLTVTPPKHTGYLRIHLVVQLMFCKLAVSQPVNLFSQTEMPKFLVVQDTVDVLPHRHEQLLL